MRSDKTGIMLECVKMAYRRVPSWEEYMRACAKELCRAPHITSLPGYENSRGAMLEKELAEKPGIEKLV